MTKWPSFIEAYVDIRRQTVPPLRVRTVSTHELRCRKDVFGSNLCGPTPREGSGLSCKKTEIKSRPHLSHGHEGDGSKAGFLIQAKGLNLASKKPVNSEVTLRGISDLACGFTRDVLDLSSAPLCRDKRLAGGRMKVMTFGLTILYKWWGDVVKIGRKRRHNPLTF